EAMDGECYVLEQMMRERHAEAQEYARRAALLRQANERPRRSNRIGSRLIELGRSLVNAARTRLFRSGSSRSSNRLNQERTILMEYRIAPLFCRPWTLNGMSPRLIESHYEHSYGAALNRLNAVSRELETLDPKTTPPQVLSRLSQEHTSLLNSTLLHELYFASLGGDGRTLPETIASAITRDFGAVNRWRDEFIAL